MFLRCHKRKKDGKLHHYWSIVESRRVAGGPPVQRQVLYLGEISDSQEAAWRKSIEVFDEEQDRREQFCLFSSDKVIADAQVNAPGVHRIEKAELFDDGEGGPVTTLDAAGTDAYVIGGGSRHGDQERRG